MHCGRFLFMLFPSWRLSKSISKYQNTVACSGLGAPGLSILQSCDGMNGWKQHIERQCNSSAQLTGQSKWGMEASGRVLIPPLLTMYFTPGIYRTKQVHFVNRVLVNFPKSHGNSMVDLNRKFPSSAHAPTTGLCFLSEEFFASRLFTSFSISPKHGQYLPRQNS